MISLEKLTSSGVPISVQVQETNIRYKFTSLKDLPLGCTPSPDEYFYFRPNFTVRVFNEIPNPITVKRLVLFTGPSNNETIIRELDLTDATFTGAIDVSFGNKNIINKLQNVAYWTHSAETVTVNLRVVYAYQGTVNVDFELGTIQFYDPIIGYIFSATQAKQKYYSGEAIDLSPIKVYRKYSHDTNVNATYPIFYSEDCTSEATFSEPVENLEISSEEYKEYTITVSVDNTTVGSYTYRVYYTTNLSSAGKKNTYVLATNVSSITKDGTAYLFTQNWSGNELLAGRYPLFLETLVEDGEYTGNSASSDCVGFIEFGSTLANRNGHVVFFEDFDNPVEGQNNIEVTFPYYVEGQADRINKAQFGIIYNNSLFVSGNPDFKNCDWHTQPINDADYDTTHDYTYFSDLDYCYYGGEDTAIVGYDIYRDGELIVFKEGARNQATLYKRTHELVNAMSYDGNSTVLSGLVEESYPMFDINSNGGEGGLSHRSITNFVGETIFLTKTGLKALTTNEDIKNNAKYTKSVSTYIDPAIVSEDLKNAVVYPLKDKLLLSTNRGLYVGYNDLKGEEGYEWYFLDGFAANYFFEYDDELYFANDEGNIYRFPKDKYEYSDESGNTYHRPARNYEYVDKDRFFIKEGGTSVITNSGDKHVVSSKYYDYIENGNEITLFGKFLVLNNATEVTASGVSGSQVHYGTYTGYLTINDTSVINLFENNKLVYVKDFVDTSFNRRGDYEGIYKLTTVTEGDNTKYYIKKAITPTLWVSPINGSFKIVIPSEYPEPIEATVQSAEPYLYGGKIFELYKNGEKLMLYPISFSGANSAIVTKKTPVSAYYITIPYSFGTLSKMKNVWSWTIANDTDLASEMDVGYLTSVNQGGFKADWAVRTTSGSRSWDFIWNPNRVQFTSDLLPHIYVRYRTIPMVNFLRFLFKNETDSNMVLSLLEVTYSIGEFSRGTK